MQGVLGGEEKDSTGLRHAEAPQASGRRSDGNGHIEREKRLAALGLAADDADGLIGPKLLDEPAAFFGTSFQPVGRLDRQPAHGRVSGFFFAVARAGLGGAADWKTSK